jgi:hypothetical protein
MKIKADWRDENKLPSGRGLGDDDEPPPLPPAPPPPPEDESLLAIDLNVLR